MGIYSDILDPHYEIVLLKQWEIMTNPLVQASENCVADLLKRKQPKYNDNQLTRLNETNPFYQLISKRNIVNNNLTSRSIDLTSRCEKEDSVSIHSYLNSTPRSRSESREY